jgi:hypothetical protein
MKHAIPVFALLLAVVAPSSGRAQLMCATSFGPCAISGSAPGESCICVTSNGPIQGTTQLVGTSPGDFPQFCCTPAGRMGPFNNTSVGPGQICQTVTEAGPMTGQACF